MKRQKLLKHLNANGCTLKREGGSHSIYENARTGAKSPVPRHSEVNDFTCRDICKQLGIPAI